MLDDFGTAGQGSEDAMAVPVAVYYVALATSANVSEYEAPQCTSRIFVCAVSAGGMTLSRRQVKPSSPELGWVS